MCRKLAIFFIYLVISNVELLAQVQSNQKISTAIGTFADDIDDGDRFGEAVSYVRDLNGDGFDDLVVGAPGDDDGGKDRGAVWILFLDAEGEVNEAKKISDIKGTTNGFLRNEDQFGASIANIGDWNADGIDDIVVGAPGEKNDKSLGELWILDLTSAGELKTPPEKITYESALNIDRRFGFGSAIVNMGDLDSDGINEIAVGAPGVDLEGDYDGAAWILFLNEDKKVIQNKKIIPEDLGSTNLEGSSLRFGVSMTVERRLSENGLKILAIGMPGDDEKDMDRGAVWIFSLGNEGEIINSWKIREGSGGFDGKLKQDNNFGSSLSFMVALDQVSTMTLVVGAPGDGGGGSRGKGELWVLFFDQNMEVMSFQKISSTGSKKDRGGFEGSLEDRGGLGASIADLGDVDGDGYVELAVGAPGNGRGSAWLLFLEYVVDGDRLDLVKDQSKIAGETDNVGLFLRENDRFGTAMEQFMDLDKDGINELVVGSPGIDSLTEGSIRILFLNKDAKIRKISKLRSRYQGDFLGSAIANLGDLDGNGFDDLALGVPIDKELDNDFGAIKIWFMDSSAVFSESSRFSGQSKTIDASTSCLAGLIDMDDQLGLSLESFDSDGIAELLVGVPSSDEGGAVLMLNLDETGEVEKCKKIDGLVENFGEQISDGDNFGSSIANIGDVNRDGIPDIAVGAPNDDDGGPNRGAVWILFLTEEGDIKGSQKISEQEGNFHTNLGDDSKWGAALIGLGDLNGDGIPDLGVGAPEHGENRFGAFWILFLDETGEVKAYEKVTDGEGQFTGRLNTEESFGASLANLGDLNTDGVIDLAVGVPKDNTGGIQKGAIWIVNINTSPVIAFEPSNIASANSGEELVIEVEVTDNGVIQDVELNIRRGGEGTNEFLSKRFAPVTRDLYKAIIPASLITDRGVEFFIRAIDDLNLITRFPESGISDIIVKVLDKRPSKPLKDDSYRLFSVPLDLLDKSPIAVLEDDLGSYDPTLWRFFEPTPSLLSSAFLEYGNTGKMASGKAFWLISEGINTFIGTGPGTSNPTAQPFEISLESGWNYIGNPFTFSIPAENLTMGSGAPLNIQTYDDAGWHSVSAIEPFEGYIVASSLEADTLYIKAEVSDDVGKASKKEKEESDKDVVWEIRLTAESGSVMNGESIVSINKASDDEWDLLDRPAPPQPMGDYVSVYFPHPEWQKYFQRYSVDTRPLSQNGEVWDFEVITNVNDLVNLSFDGIEAVPQGFEVWLVDEAVNFSQNLREVNTYSVAGPLENYPKQLKLVVGKSGYIEEQGVISTELPNDFQLSQNFSNPFSSTTTIPFALPKPAPVTLTVYSILGERVATILQGEEKPAGYHAAIWDGRNDAGVPAASGLYFIQLQAGSFIETRKMMLVK